MSKWVLVPTEPTDQMKSAPHPNASFTDVYKDMVDAAPSCENRVNNMNETIRQLYDTIERMERNANGHDDRGETNTAIQLRHWAEQLRETLNRTKSEWNLDQTMEYYNQL